jgi:hypothetical protein
MSKKNLVLVFLICWGNIGLFYLFYLLKFEPVLVGVFRELTMIPSYVGGVVCAILLTYKLLKEKFL